MKNKAASCKKKEQRGGAEVSIPLRGIGYEKQELVEGMSGARYQAVSIPLRGIGYEKLRFDIEVALNDQGCRVSIPLRGIGYEKRNMTYTYKGYSVFPSPCGELVMKNGTKVTS